MPRPAATAPLSGAAAERAELAERVVSVSARLVRTAGRQAPVPLSIAQTRTLAHLRDAGPLRITQLAARERCAQPSMTTLVARLESAGLVSRGNDPHDARAVRVALTRLGAQTLTAARQAMGAGLAERLASLDADELECLRRATGILERLGDDRGADNPTDAAGRTGEDDTTRGSR